MTSRGGAFDLAKLTGPEQGPVVSLIGGVHGDEEEGVLAVQRVCARLRETPLRRGTLRAVAVAHPAAYAVDARLSPLDGGNLARSFPGSPGGTATERLAWTLNERVIRGSDLLLDLHSAGRAYAMPLMAGWIDDEGELGARSARAAAAFGAPIAWRHPAPGPPGRTLSAARALGIPSCYVEGSGGGMLRGEEVDAFVDGVLAVLADLGMTVAPSRRPRLLVPGGSGNVDAGVAAPCAGRFVVRARAGAQVAAGGVVGEIVDEDGAVAAALTAPTAGTLMFVRRAARIAAGEMVYALAPPAVPWPDE